MSSGDVTVTQGIGRTVGPVPADAERAKVRALAEQFESMLLAQMLREMKQAMTPEAEDQGLGGQMMGDTITTELAMALGHTGSLGLSELVATAMGRLETAGSGPAEPGVPTSGEAPVPGSGPALIAPVVAAASAAPAAVASASPAGPPQATGVTSPYGWRVDPLHGQHRFHAGLDLRAAYGQDVRAATEGVVTFAGEQAGYGLVVVVSHGSGLETRYAHLSSAEVAQGERVGAGDVIARSGNSGRTTGPHLHFEVRHHGEPVDPGRVAGLGPVVSRPDQTSAS